MILQSLVQYYETLAQKGEISGQGWSTAKVSFGLDISREGELLGIVDLKIEVPRGKKTAWVPQNLRVPQMVARSSGVSANFLCDNSGYFLGIDNKGKPQRSLECFYAARERHLSILKDTEGAAAESVVKFFSTWEPENAAENQVLAPVLEEVISGANLVFLIDGKYAQEDWDIRRAWENCCRESEKEPDGLCLVTGQKAEIARIHGTIKGVQGAQSSGAALVSFNAPAFESYGKEQSFNAPVGKYAAYAYTTALNHLLSDRTHTTTIGDTTIVYWSEDGNEVYQNVFSASVEPTVDNQEIIDNVFKKLNVGRAVAVDSVIEDLSMDQEFCILGLSPNAARLAVRFFYQDSFGNILSNLKSHYDQMEIVRPSSDSLEYMGIWRLLQETVNKKSRDKKPADNLPGAVFRAVISGTPYPAALYEAVIGRIRVEQDNKDARIYKITRGRAAIIKAYLIRNRQLEKEGITVGLNEECKNTAYILGREFAVLEAIQEKSAKHDLNVTIKDKYFNSACATPAVIFPILFKLKNSHIKKIEDKGAVINFEKTLGNLQDLLEVDENQLTACPKRLSLEEQGMFVLGYYHQTQKRFEKTAKEENQNG